MTAHTTTRYTPAAIAADPAPQVGQRVEIIPGGFSGDQGVIKRASYGRYMVETDSGLLTGYYRAEQLTLVEKA
jgi:hypothetical protein